MSDRAPVLQELMSWGGAQLPPCNYGAVTARGSRPEASAPVAESYRFVSRGCLGRRLHKQGHEVSAKQPSRDVLSGARGQPARTRSVGSAMAGSLAGLEGGMGTVKGKVDWGHEFFFKGTSKSLTLNYVGLGKLRLCVL